MSNVRALPWTRAISWPGSSSCAVAHLEIDVLIEQREQLDARDHYAFPHAESAAGLPIGRYAQLRGDVARPDVFGERAFDDFGRCHQS